MAHRVRYKTFNQLSFADIMVYSKLPIHPFWSRVEEKIDFSFADKLCSVLYTGRGQNPFAPSLKLKIHLVEAYYNISDRKTEEKIIGDIFIKRFLGLPVDFFDFDHSTIGLDRNRMGTTMFHACHLYILAQMNSLGLWGDKNEKWIIDSFPTNVAIAKVGAYRLIQRGMIRIFQHLKRSYPHLYKETYDSVAWDGMLFRLPSSSSKSDQMLAFSKLVGQAYGLLQWFQLDNTALLIKNWKNDKAKQALEKLQSNLMQILQENSQIIEESDSDSNKDDQGDQGQNQPPVVKYEKIPFKKRLPDRIISVTDPDARISKKGKATIIKGYKTQNLCTSSGVILDTKVIPATEHDRDAMFQMVRGIQSFFGITPLSVLGDTAYGHGKQRLALASLNIPVVAPVPITQNPTGLYDISRFHYDNKMDVFICPNDKKTNRKSHSPKNEGSQYYFSKNDCHDCPFQKDCTTNKNGRSVFLSDYHPFYETAKEYNQSDQGIEDLKQRYLVERKNQELKNDCGLGRIKTRSKKTASIKAKLAAIVVNIKLTVRRFFSSSPGFIRHSRTS